MTPGSSEKISNALGQLQRRLKKELKAETKKGISQEKTSVVGGSSIFTNHDLSSPRRKAEIERMRIKAEQDRVAEAFKRVEEEERASAHLASSSSVQLDASGTRHDHEEYPERCFICSKETSQRCSLCQRDFYCSQSCEDKRSGRHLFTCAKRPLTSADFLYRSIEEDRMPEEEDVCSDFGFNYFESFADKSKLLGLYKGLWINNVPVEDVHKGQVEGSLVANIKEVFTRYLTNTGATERTVTTFFDEARSYLDKEDRDKHFNELEPEAKRDCFYMLALNLHMAHPNPIETHWFNFGFCTCYDEYEEGPLGSLFEKLPSGGNLFDDVPTAIPRTKNIQTATFTEFWKAYESGTMIQLMDSKGFKHDRLQFPYLEEFFTSPPCGPHLSLWSLKQFLAINNPAEFPPDPTISVDYGFMNCKAFMETCTLMELYKRFLPKASPLDFHEACVAGKLFEFAECFHKMNQAHRRLMRNFYPLGIE